MKFIINEIILDVYFPYIIGLISLTILTLCVMGIVLKRKKNEKN